MVVPLFDEDEQRPVAGLEFGPRDQRVGLIVQVRGLVGPHQVRVQVMMLRKTFPAVAVQIIGKNGRQWPRKQAKEQAGKQNGKS
ncbi:MAG: hypothetical protein FJW20_20880 [Acidimicrobiia bacterium]|nr:hypothetical protein [Acidimicrobiia bacterium]